MKAYGRVVVLILVAHLCGLGMNAAWARAGRRPAKRAVDRNRDGRVDRKERHKFRENDTNRDGRIDRHEVADRNDDGTVDAKEKKEATLRRFDRNKDGTIDDKEDAAIERFKDNDTNEDGRIDKHEMADRNNDGTVDGKEAFYARRKVNSAKEKVFDTDGDGWISVAEAKAMQTLVLFDVDNDGALSEAEEAVVAKAVVDTELEEEFDENGDGYIGPKEARKLRAYLKEQAAADDDD